MLQAKAYSDDVRLHISPAIGQIRLTSLTPPQVQKFVNSLIEDKKLAPKTVKDIHGTLHRALTKAVQYGYIKNNPADNCDLPQMVEKEIQIIDEDMARKLSCKTLRMDTNQTNSAARALYKKLGFTEVGIVPCEFNGISGVNLVLLEKILKKQTASARLTRGNFTLRFCGQR